MGIDFNQISATKLGGMFATTAGDEFEIFVNQRKTFTVWILTTDNTEEKIFAALKITSTGQMSGWGQTWYLTRLLDSIANITAKAVASNSVKMYDTYTRCDYVYGEDRIDFTSTTNGKYMNLSMFYDGLRITLSPLNKSIPRLPTLVPMQDRTLRSAVVANLGVKTAEQLFMTMKERLSWYRTEDAITGEIIYHKKYRSVKNDDEAKAMFLDFIKYASKMTMLKQEVIIGLDTETTGLYLYELSKSNTLLDHIVAVPFAWKDDEAYVIFVDMVYFTNATIAYIGSTIQKICSRNKDFTGNMVTVVIDDVPYQIDRNYITVTGHYTIFDTKAFLSDGYDVFFDEDTMQIGFNLATDLAVGRNDLKTWTRVLFHHETLELEELFGKAHKDKYAYLQDEELALIYGGADADYSRLVLKKLRAILPKNLYIQYKMYDMCLNHLYAHAEYHGIPVDAERIKAGGELVEEDLESIRSFIYTYAYKSRRELLARNMKRLAEHLSEVYNEEQSDMYESIKSVLAEADADKKFTFAFTPNNNKELLFNILRYPVLARTPTGEAKLDKNVLKKLMSDKLETPNEVLTGSLLSPHRTEQDGKPVVLIDKDEFNSDKYPLARVYSTYGVLSKEYTAYYMPVIKNNLEGKLFFNFRTTKAATRRIINPGQTMKGELKRFVTAPANKLFAAWDVSQMEYRLMASEAYIRIKRILKSKFPDDWERRLEATNIAKIFHKMHDPESDYHIETASQMTHVKPHLVTKKVRKRYKSIGFGIPYGLGVTSMCEQLFGKVTSSTLQDTKLLLSDYNVKQSEIIELLEETRDGAFIPAEVSQEFRDAFEIGDANVGVVKNFSGFYRLFVLKDLTRKRVGRIRRQAGNCLIQGGAAELFRRMLYQFHLGCVKAGIDDKIQWVLTVHDELDFLISDDIDIVKLIKVAHQSCTIRYEDHIPYFIGLGFGLNWAEAKDDANELPVIMVERMIEAYDKGIFSIPSDGHQHEYLSLLKHHYMCDRIYEEVTKIMSTTSNPTKLDAKLLDEKLENYAVRAYLDAFIPVSALTDGDKKIDVSKISFVDKLKYWVKARKAYGIGVDFLSTQLTPITDGESDLAELSLESASLDDFDLSLSSFGNESEEELLLENEGYWFDESSLFNPNADYNLDDESSTSNISLMVNDDESMDDKEYFNPNATNPHEVFLTDQYIRKSILKSRDKIYTISLVKTIFRGNTTKASAEILKRIQVGSGDITLILTGTSTKIIKKVSASAEDLDLLDKFLNGQEEKIAQSK